MKKYSESLSFTPSHTQLKALEGLQYWIAELHYLKNHKHTVHDENKARTTIEKCCFPQCDRLQIPFWVQNAVIMWAESGRYQNEYFSDFIKSLE